jgi:methyl-accepting chemotaxis protein
MEQLAGLQQSLDSLFGTIRENSNKVSVTATISKDLNKLAHELNGLMGRFSFEKHQNAERVDHEKRCCPRAHNGLLAMLHAEGNSRIEGISSDFSMCGMQLRLPPGTKISKGDKREIDLFTPCGSVEEFKKQKPLQIRVEVIWARSQADSLACGLAFEKLKPEQNQRLEDCFKYFHKPSHY